MDICSNTAVQQIMAELGSDVLLTGLQMQGRFSHIWKINEPLDVLAIVMPRDASEVSAICRICHELDQPIVIHGGLTGLVGATDAHATDIVVSLERMNKIEEVDEKSRTMRVQAGVILEEIHKEAEKRKMFFPLSFGAKGSAQIGGCISTNAGGLRVLKYGMTRNLVLGLETVLADGTIIRSLKKIIKDNSGYGLNQLFIGAEGTLGIITRAVLKLEEKPRSRNSAFIGFDEYYKVVEFLKLADGNLSGQLSGFEIMWGDTYRAITTFPSHKAPLKHGYKYYVLIETLGGDPQKDRLLVETVLEKSIALKLFSDALVAYTAADSDRFWNIREDVGIINTLSPFQQHFDVSISIDVIEDYVTMVKSALESVDDVMHCYAFGHLADGNIHFIVGKKNESEELKSAINEIIYFPLETLNGSVSAEHGIGMDKRTWLPVSRTCEEIELMRKIKHVMDPKWILNRGRIIAPIDNGNY